MEKQRADIFNWKVVKSVQGKISMESFSFDVVELVLSDWRIVVKTIAVNAVCMVECVVDVGDDFIVG